MSEKEQGHRHKFLDRAQQENAKARNFGFVLAVISLVGGIYLLSTGQALFLTHALILAVVLQLISTLVRAWLPKVREKEKTE